MLARWGRCLAHVCHTSHVRRAPNACRSWPSSGATASGKTRPLPRPGRAARRRGRQHRRDAGLPRHGHRHGEAARRPSDAASRTTCSTPSTSASRPRWRSSRAGRVAVIAELRGRGATPVLVGGSALYTRAILDRFEFPGTDEAVRPAGGRARPSRLGRRCTGCCASVDPEAAARILPENGRRIVRALEVIELTGGPYSASAPDAGVRRPAHRPDRRRHRPADPRRSGSQRRVDDDVRRPASSRR